MSLFNTMRTATSGMAAQSNALSTIGDNIANTGTDGYKEATAQFETMLGVNATAAYESGGVQTDIRYGITDQGTLTSTSSATDLAVSGSGFFVVSKNGEGSYMTRAGSFVPDSSGNLVNAAGYELMGYQQNPDGTGSSSLSVVNVSSTDLQAAASTSGSFTGNLPSTADTVAAANLPSTNTASATYSDKTSITVYDNLGKADVLDVYMTKSGNNTWEATAYNQSDAAPGGGFPYSSAAVGTTNLTYDPKTGSLAAGSPTSLSVTVANGNKVPIDLSATSQLASGFALTPAADGNAPSKLDHINIGTDGTLSKVYASGVQVSAYKIPLATVVGPDNLTSLSGNVYQVSPDSGPMVLSTAGNLGVGSIEQGQLELSTVDLATELTNMIQVQRAYEANSKVLQAGSDLLGVLNRLTTN